MNTEDHGTASVDEMGPSSTFVERLQRVLRDRGWTPYEWSTRAGLTNSHVQNLIARGAKRPAGATTHKLAVAAGVGEAWLARGEGAMIAPAPSTGPVVDLDVDDPKMKHRENFDANLEAAKDLVSLKPYVWEALAESDPLLVVPLTPALLADLASVLAKYLPAPPPKPRR